MSTVALMSLDDRVLHVPSDEHGVARCGETMRDPWAAGPFASIDRRAVAWCEVCCELSA